MTFPQRSVCGTNLAYASLAEWLGLAYRLGGTIRASSAHYNRCAQLYRSLRAMDIRRSHDIATLAKCERLFDLSRQPGDIPLGGYGMQRVLSRADLGAILVETRNRLDALRSGRADRYRPKGPRFDPARLPVAALDRLIQQHPDLDIVERLRNERGRRALQGETL